MAQARRTAKAGRTAKRKTTGLSDKGSTAVGKKAKGRKRTVSSKSERIRVPQTSRVRDVTVKPGATALFEVSPQLERVISAIGSNTAADLLNVSRSQPSRWRTGKERISPTNQARLADLDHVLNRLLQVLWPEEASTWLTARNPYLGGRPVDVLGLRGAAPVIEAIDALAQGAYV
jgi:uncharacterized protein (DUF2384 family)